MLNDFILDLFVNVFKINISYTLPDEDAADLSVIKTNAILQKLNLWYTT